MVVEYKREIDARVSPRRTVLSVPCTGSSDAVGLADGDGRVDAVAGPESVGSTDADADGLATSAGVGEATGVEHADPTTSSVSTPASQAERGIG